MLCRLLLRWLLVIACCGPAMGPVSATAAESLADFNARLGGRIVDHTQNHGADRRIWSAILCQRRDVYVYLPPGYHSEGSYPLVVWCHGAFGDEHSFLDTAQIDYLDRLIRCACCPPMIVVCADGTCSGENRLLGKHSFYTNGCCGRFEDHIMQEVLPMVESCYSVCPGRQARAIIGVSAGAYGGLAMAIKYRDYFSAGVSNGGAINLRYDNVQGDYFADFSPQTYRWRTTYNPREVIGRYAGGLIRIRGRMYIDPVFGSNPGVVQRVALNNPADLLFTTDLKPGEIDLLITYGDEDNLNFDAHAESFAWLARCCRGVDVSLVRYPGYDHSLEFFRISQQYAWRWLGARLRCTSDEQSPAPTAVETLPEGSLIVPPLD